MEYRLDLDEFFDGCFQRDFRSASAGVFDPTTADSRGE